MTVQHLLCKLFQTYRYRHPGKTGRHFGKTKGQLGKTGGQWERLWTSGKTDGDIGLTTLISVTIVTTNKENDSPKIDREGGVEDQSSTETVTRLMDNGTDIGQPQRIMEHDDKRITDNGTDLGQPQRKTENTQNYTCTQCQKSFGTEKGLKIHQGKVCMKKKQCRSQDRQTRNRPTQEFNHSGQVNVTAETSEQSTFTPEEAKRKPKIAWPASKEKASYRNFEEKVCKKIYKTKGTVHERLKKLAETIYETGKDTFGEKPTKKTRENKKGETRRERKMKEVRKEKKDLRKRWRQAGPEEKEGLTRLYEECKKKCRNMQGGR